MFRQQILLSWLMKILVSLMLCLGLEVVAQESNRYTLEEASSFHDQWTLSNWDDGGPLSQYVYLNMAEFWPHQIINRSGPVQELPLNLRPDVSNFETTTRLGTLPLDEFIEATTLDGVVVLHQGKVVLESYPRMNRSDKHLYFSLSKPFVATAVAILEGREQINTSQPISAYLPELIGSDWETIPVRDLLDMASGINCIFEPGEDFSNPETCLYQFEASMGWTPKTMASIDDPYKFITSLRSHRASGEAFEYTDVNTFVLRWLVEKISGFPYFEFIETEIWQPMGAESDAILVTPLGGPPRAGAGISSSLKDLARFGLLFTPSGRTSPNSIVSQDYLDKIQKGGRPSIFNVARERAQLIDGEPARHNSYHWDWVMEDGDFFKSGYGGMGLYISPSRDLVIGYFATPSLDGGPNFMRDAARQLAKSGLFD